MKLAVFGLWHLGAVTAACTAAAGVATVGIDLDRERIAKLAAGEPPLYEPGLAELTRSGIAKGTLVFSPDVGAVAHADIVWICHDTPVDEEDRADPDAVREQVEMLFPHLGDGAVVLVSAQLPVGSVATLETSFAAQANGRTVSFACSPENLRLGKAIEVFQNPGRIIVGVRDHRARAVLEPLLKKFCETLIWMSVESAEMVKHGLNAFLAMSVTYANEIATVCERVGADAAEVEKGLRSDPRIGPGAYVRAGPAFAGGTLARDVQFLRTLAQQHDLTLPVMDGILASNHAHGQWAYRQLSRALKPLAGRTVGVLGLAYKAGTSALRRSPSVELIQALLKDGARVQAYDPHVSSLPDELKPVKLCADARSAAAGADALVVGNESPEFRTLSADEAATAMKGRIVLDASRFLGATLGADKRLSLISVGRVS
jgi:UDPglucose 6-dehydrogenase